MPYTRGRMMDDTIMNACPFCFQKPVMEVKPPYPQEPWSRLGNRERYSCPNGHMKTRFKPWRSARKAWNTNVRWYENIINKSEITSFARKCKPMAIIHLGE